MINQTMLLLYSIIIHVEQSGSKEMAVPNNDTSTMLIRITERASE
jgi:hypothetical protein